MGITPGVYHMNEGHSGFAVLEAIRMRMADEGVTFDQAVPAVAREVVFTTHTPVPAGHDRFHADLVEEHLGPLREELGISHDHLMFLGREDPNDRHGLFCMTVVGLKLSRRANAVSSLHGEVSRAMWTGLYPGRSEDAVPIGHITNGVHVPSWLAPQMARLYDRHLGAGWQMRSGKADTWRGHRERGRRGALGDASEPQEPPAGLRAAARGGTIVSGGANPRKRSRAWDVCSVPML